MARRDVVENVLDTWTSDLEDEATVEGLLRALNYPDFKDVKMRVEKIIQMAT